MLSNGKNSARQAETLNELLLREFEEDVREFYLSEGYQVEELTVEEVEVLLGGKKIVWRSEG